MIKKAAGLVALTLFSGCSMSGGPVDILPYNSPVDEESEIRRVGQGNIVGDYQHRTPVKPGEWRKLNDEQSPAKETDS